MPTGLRIDLKAATQLQSIIYSENSIYMSNHQEIPEDIRKQIKEFQNKIASISTLKGSAREEAVVKQQRHIKRIRRLMDTYQCSIQSGAFENAVTTHKSQYKEFEVQINRLQKQLESTRHDIGTQEDLFRHKPKSSNKVQLNNRQMMIEEGDRAQKEGAEALGRIEKNIIVMDEQANVIMTELDRQIEKLDQIYEELNDTETTLKRAEKHLKYFARQVYTDRCLVFLIIIIAIAIIVIIGLAIAGKTPQQMNNQVK